MASITTLQAGQTFWRYDTDVFSDISEHIFDPNHWHAQNAIVGQSEGRGITWFLKHENHELVLKHYRRGGLIGKINPDKYLFKNWQETRAYKEFTLLAQMMDEGLPVPRPIAIQIIKQGIYYQADLITQRIQHARDLCQILVDHPLERRMYEKIGDTIRRFHDAGIYHADLNIHNILIDDQEQIWIIDFDKGERRKPNSQWRKENLNRLARSFAKERERYGVKIEGCELIQTHYQ